MIRSPLWGSTVGRGQAGCIICISNFVLGEIGVALGRSASPDKGFWRRMQGFVNFLKFLGCQSTLDILAN